MPAVERCATMDEVRDHIDRLDRKLVAILAERAGYVAQAGLIKERADQVRDPARIEDVVAKVRAEAARLGLEPDIAEATWRAMIEAFIDYEGRVFETRGDRS